MKYLNRFLLIVLEVIKMYEEDDFYDDDTIEEYQENDCLSDMEACFMHGYLNA